MNSEQKSILYENSYRAVFVKNMDKEDEICMFSHKEKSDSIIILLCIGLDGYVLPR